MGDHFVKCFGYLCIISFIRKRWWEKVEVMWNYFMLCLSYKIYSWARSTIPSAVSIASLRNTRWTSTATFSKWHKMWYESIVGLVPERFQMKFMVYVAVTYYPTFRKLSIWYQYRCFHFGLCEPEKQLIRLDRPRHKYRPTFQVREIAQYTIYTIIDHRPTSCRFISYGYYNHFVFLLWFTEL